jgi:hypothetical protein
MDLVVRYWNSTKNCVVTQYLAAAFLGHARAEDLLTGFTTAVKELSMPKLIQVSMDGPSVNCKFVKLPCAKLQEISDMKLLELGSCGLHAVHGAIQTGHGASGWAVNATLKAMYSLFKDSPARRADFTSVTGSSKFPLKFCQIRWVENVTVAQRALEVYPNVKKYVLATKILPSTTAVSNIRVVCADSLTEAKIAFFLSIAAVMEPFLKKYQTAKPSAVFLYDDLTRIIRTLMSRFIKPSLLQENKMTAKLLKIDVKLSNNRVSYKECSIGVAAQKFLSDVSLSERGHMQFRMQCVEFLAASTVKIMERSPLQYSLCRALSCLQPSMIGNNSLLAAKRMPDQRMPDLLDILYENNQCTSSTADKAKNDFSRLY